MDDAMIRSYFAFALDDDDLLVVRWTDGMMTSSPGSPGSLVC
jgi:hypothetical protein